MSIADYCVEYGVDENGCPNMYFDDDDYDDEDDEIDEVVNGELILNFDGGAKPNPGVGTFGYVIRSSETDEILEEAGGLCEKDGITRSNMTNNEAEYEGLIIGMERAYDLGTCNLIIKGDSELVINQMNGVYKCKSINLKPLFTRAKDIASQFTNVTFIHVPREDNTGADYQAKLAQRKRKRE